MDKVEQSMDFLRQSEHGKYAEEILSFYVPLALSLPQLRDNPEAMHATVKATSASGITDVVTLADLGTQQNIKEKINELHSGWQFWGEEGVDNITEYDLSKPFLLITDPIEGTNNFKARKDDQWGSVVALVDTKTKQPVVGIVAHPSRKQFYVGIKGHGAYILTYSENNQLANVSQMKSTVEFNQFTYNNSPHFNQELTAQVERFIALGEVEAISKQADELEKSRKTIRIPRNSESVTFVDPESGALEAVRYRGTIYFKTSNEMAAVFVILQELGGKVTDADGNPWSFGINTMITARTEQDYTYLKSLMDKVRS